MTEKALILFTELEVKPTLQSKILELEPEFAKLPETEQREMIMFFLEQAAKTQEGVKSRFPTLDIKHAGTKMFEMPVKAGEEDRPLSKEFEAVILDQYLTKAYWQKRFGQGGKGPPDCASTDGLNPYVDNPINPPDKGGCIACPYNRFGSGIDDQGNKTRGKLCRDVKRIIIWLEGHALPIRMSVSAANIKEFDKYMNDLLDQDQPVGTILTKFRAVEAANRNNVEYTGLQLTTVRKLTWKEMKALNDGIVKPFKPDFRLGAIEAFDDESDQQAPTAEQTEGQSTKAADVMG